MESEESIIDILIAKHLTGEINSDESKYLLTWKTLSPDNQRYYDQLEKIWYSAQPVQLPIEVYDTESALLKVKNEIIHRRPAGTVRIMAFRYLAYAAVLAGMIWGITSIMNSKNDNQPIQTIAATAHIISDTLSDGSRITLNKTSGLTVLQGYNKKERRLRLEGEAYFEVAHDKSKPFIVEVADISVLAVGTAFNIDYKSNPDQIYISVTEGIVKIGGSMDPILLSAGEQATYTVATRSLQKITGTLNPNSIAYTNRIFNFEASPLSEVLPMINEAYDIHITLEHPELERCILTGRYNNLSKERVLELIAASFSFELIPQGDNGYVLKGTSCNE